jgi:UDP-N-acetyl-D-mannosaminuronate dehydrogenase
MLKMQPTKVSVVGLGKLGLCVAAVLADRGFKVVGIDVDKAKVDAVNSGRSLIPEPSLEDLIRKTLKTLGQLQTTMMRLNKLRRVS